MALLVVLLLLLGVGDMETLRDAAYLDADVGSGLTRLKLGLGLRPIPMALSDWYLLYAANSLL